MPRDVKEPGGCRPVSAALLKRFPDKSLFYRFERDTTVRNLRDFCFTASLHRLEFQIGYPDGDTLPQDDTSLHHVLQFADIPGPVIGFYLRQGLPAEMNAGWRLKLFQEMGCQLFNIFRALPQRWQVGLAWAGVRQAGFPGSIVAEETLPGSAAAPERRRSAKRFGESGDAAEHRPAFFPGYRLENRGKRFHPAPPESTRLVRA